MELPPVASILMQSLRSVGYTPSAALADLVDNSIAAHATTIRIRVEVVPRAFVAIVDDGVGMDDGTLVRAMRFGSRDPRDARHGADLGRFGLGLKTASLSQCRRLTVATTRDGRLSIARWDLDECDRRATWWLDRPDGGDLPEGIVEDLVERGHGTAVIWQELDRLGAADIERAIVSAADYLAMAFHRFLAGDSARLWRSS